MRSQDRCGSSGLDMCGLQHYTGLRTNDRLAKGSINWYFQTIRLLIPTGQSLHPPVKSIISTRSRVVVPSKRLARVEGTATSVPSRRLGPSPFATTVASLCLHSLPGPPPLGTVSPRPSSHNAPPGPHPGHTQPPLSLRRRPRKGGDRCGQYSRSRRGRSARHHNGGESPVDAAAQR